MFITYTKAEGHEQNPWKTQLREARAMAMAG